MCASKITFFIAFKVLFAVCGFIWLQSTTPTDYSLIHSSIHSCALSILHSFDPITTMCCLCCYDCGDACVYICTIACVCVIFSLLNIKYHAIKLIHHNWLKFFTPFYGPLFLCCCCWLLCVCVYESRSYNWQILSEWKTTISLRVNLVKPQVKSHYSQKAIMSSHWEFRVIFSASNKTYKWRTVKTKTLLFIKLKSWS